MESKGNKQESSDLEDAKLNQVLHNLYIRQVHMHSFSSFVAHMLFNGSCSIVDEWVRCHRKTVLPEPPKGILKCMGLCDGSWKYLELKHFQGVLLGL